MDRLTSSIVVDMLDPERRVARNECDCVCNRFWLAVKRISLCCHQLNTTCHSPQQPPTTTTQRSGSVYVCAISINVLQGEDPLKFVHQCKCLASLLPFLPPCLSQKPSGKSRYCTDIVLESRLGPGMTLLLVLLFTGSGMPGPGGC
jgi:hypothetical protein